MKPEPLVIRVNRQGTGDYATLAEAVRATPYEISTEIELGPGVYEEKVFCEKKRLFLRGAGQGKTVLRWHDGAYQRHEDGRNVGTFRSYTLFLGGEWARLRDLTIENTAGDGETAGQGLAVYADASSVWMENVTLSACQDTLFLAPLPQKERQKDGFLGPRMLCPRRETIQYYINCHILGDVDFIFGGADAVFDRCLITSLDRGKAVNGYITAPSGNPRGLGFVFRRCAFESAAAPGTVYLGRPWRAYGKTALLDCRLGAHIAASGWDDWQDEANRLTAVFSEWGSVGEGANLQLRAPWSRRLTLSEAEDMNQRAEACKERVLGPWLEK